MEEKVYSVFISYCWTNSEHEKWVHDLALRLMEADGIDVKLDKWDLKPGQDKFVFMESMVNDDSINKVLLICDKGYKEKADNRTGGVGTETQIVTAEIYNKTEQEKFIPVIAETGEKFDSYMPTYLKSRIGIDMSNEKVYEEGYEKLLRTIAERPMYRKPTRGKLPSYLFEEEISHFRTKSLNKQLKTFIFNKPENAKYIISDFIEEFINTLNEFKIDANDFKEPYDEQIYSNIKEMLPLRDDYIEFLSLICIDNNTFNLDNIIKLFEEMYPYTEFQEYGNSYDIQFDHFKFFVNELFLYTTIILLKNGLYEQLSILLNTKFLVKHREELLYVNFDEFRFYICSLDQHRKNRLKSQYISITAELMIQRSTFNNKSYKGELIDADLLLYYISAILKNKKTQNDIYRVHCWFPTTYIYGEYRKNELLVRLASTRFFEKAKILFNVSSKDEMQDLITNFQNPYKQGYNYSFQNIPHIQNYIKPEDICSFA